MSYARSRTISSDEIPVIDIGPLLDGTAVESVGASLAWAATEVGFIYVENHGIAPSVIDAARRSGLRFFGEPLERKLASAINPHHHGYLCPGATRMHDDAAVDLKESFNFGLELGSDTLANVADNPLIGPNVWPADMPWFKDGVYPFFESSTRCAEAVLSGFAMAAGLAPDCFTRHADLPISRGSLQFYPPQPSELGADRFGVSAHTDFGVLTVLCQDDIGGLELESLDGEWIAVPPIPSTMVVNVGDLLARWSNGRYRSTPHRVINTSGRERLSVVLAYDPNFETLADPSLFCDAGEATIAPPITCGEYLMRRFEKAFAYRR